MDTDVVKVASEHLNILERRRLQFAQTFKDDLSKHDLKEVTTEEVVDKYATLFAAMEGKIQELLMDALLKGFYRRDFFINQVQKIITEADKLKSKFPNYKGSVIVMIDYDNFKLANETHEHKFGDKVLQEVAKVVKKHIQRKSDILGREDEDEIGHTTGRHGGDELIALLFDTDIEGAALIANRIQTEVDQLQILAPDGTTWHQTLSIGVAAILPTDTSSDEVIARADSAAFQAKHLGKNQVVVFDQKVLNPEEVTPHPLSEFV